MDENTIDIEGVVGWDVTALGVKRALRNLGDVEEFNVLINSPGGYIDEGFGIYTAIKNHSARVNVHIVGMAASMGSVIAMAGDTVTIEETGMFMIHPPSSIVWGSAEDMRNEAQVLDKYESRIVKAYGRRDLNLSDEELAADIAASTYYTAEEALSAGFVDEVTDGENLSENSTTNALEWFRVARYKNVPEALQKKIKPNKAKTNALLQKLTKTDGSAVENATEGNAMSKEDDKKKYSEAELQAAVNTAKEQAAEEATENSVNTEAAETLAAMLNHPTATIERVRQACEMGLNAEQAGKYMDNLAAASAQAPEANAAPDSAKNEPMSTADLLQKIVAMGGSNGDLSQANLNAASGELNEGGDSTPEDPDPKELFNRLKKDGRETLQ